MHLLGRHTIDDRTLHLSRRLETWERFQRAQEAECVARYVLDNRQKYALNAPDLKRLDTWIDRVFALGLSVIPGGTTGGGAVLTPVDVVGTANIWDWWRTDSGITVATGVSTWVPIVGSNTFTQATGTKQPIFTANDSTLFGRGTFVGDGTDDVLAAPNPNMSAPSISVPFFHRLIFKTVTWVAAGALFGTGNNNNSVNGGTSSPNLQQRSTVATNVNGGAAVGTWTRLEAYFSGTTADSLKLGTTLVASGVSAGVTAPGTVVNLCSRGTANFLAAAVAEYLFLKILPSSLQLALLDGLTAHFYKGVPAM